MVHFYIVIFAAHRFILRAYTGNYAQAQVWEGPRCVECAAAEQSVTLY